MLLGVPKEIKNNEFRVGMVPASVQEVVAAGHRVIVETNAGSGIGYSDSDYESVGAEIRQSAAEIFAEAEMIVKVKEPQAVERAMLREDQILFTYLHLAPDMPQTEDLVKSGAVCIAYETVTSPFGGLPLLAPMSEVAGRMSIQAGAHALEKHKHLDVAAGATLREEADHCDQEWLMENASQKGRPLSVAQLLSRVS